jgi:RNA-directed DNA polymerase
MPARSLLAREPVAATLAEPPAEGGRLDRSPAAALEPGPRVWSLSTAAQGICEGASRACCDRLSHDGVGTPRPLDHALRRQGRPAGVMETPRRSPTETGVPHGGVMAPVIRHLARPGRERHLPGALPPCQGTHRTTVHGSRGAEEVLSTGRSTDVLAQAVPPRVAQGRAERGLARAREQTRGTPMEAGCAVLGPCVRTDPGQLVCPPAKKNVRSVLDTRRGIVTRPKHARTGNVSLPWHPVMRGGAQSPQQGARTRTVAQGDQQVFPLRWPWARRRHPRTSRQGMRDT